MPNQLQGRNVSALAACVKAVRFSVVTGSLFSQACAHVLGPPTSLGCRKENRSISQLVLMGEYLPWYCVLLAKGRGGQGTVTAGRTQSGYC